MKKHLIATTAIAVLSLASASAFATATANANITGLTITLGQINAKAGAPAPSATFTQAYGDRFHTAAFSYDPNENVWHEGYGGTPFGDGTSSTTLATAGSSVGVTGDAWSDAGADFRVSSWADGTSSLTFPYAGSDGSVYLGEDGGATTFTLGANTFLNITAQYAIDTGVTSLATNRVEEASAAVFLRLYGTNGVNSQESSAYAMVASQNYYGNISTPVNASTGELDLSFMGSRTAITTGMFTGFVTSFASSNVSAVPEPSSLAFMLGGLAALGLMARRRR